MSYVRENGEIIVKCPVSTLAAGLARLIGGEIIKNAYGKCLVPGKRASVVPDGIAENGLGGEVQVLMPF
jgi:hypothetical protein